MIAYPVPGKQKSADICAAFLEGAGKEGRASDAAVFFGVTDGNVEHWRRVRAEKREFYYIDNSYFDATRGTHLRITRNRLQHDGSGKSDCLRLVSAGIRLYGWREKGKHILVCPQSDLFMRVIAGYQGNWLEEVLRRIAAETDLPVRVRHWSPDKRKLSSTLQQDLAQAWALVTWSSAAAVEALLAGVPVFVDCEDCAAWRFGGWGLNHLDTPRYPEGRAEWAAVLADNQWTMDEISSGRAWRDLNGIGDTGLGIEQASTHSSILTPQS